MPRITKREVDGAEPGDRIRFVWDDTLPGFGLVVRPTGRKAYVVQYRNAQKRTRRLVLGSHGVLTPDQARRLAAAKLAAAHSGRDPAEEMRATERALNVAELAERYIEEHIPKKKDSSAREDRRILDTYVLPTLGSRRLGDVTARDIAKFHLSMQFTPIMANRVLFLLSTLFNLAERWGLREHGENPCRYVQRFRERRRERFLSMEELQRLGKALAAVEREATASRVAIAAIRLLALTGARRGEILDLAWDHVDLARGTLHLPDSKTGEKVILLDDHAVSLLQSLPKTGPWVFPSSKKPGTALHDIRKTWVRVLDKAEIKGVRIHDLRHTHASVGAASGLSLPLIGGLLGHRRAATTERYAHLADHAQRAAARIVQQQIARALDGDERPVTRTGDSGKRQSRRASVAQSTVPALRSVGPQ
jgi:integrase